MFLTIEQVGAELDYSPQTVLGRIGDGSLRAISAGAGGELHVPKMELEAFKRRTGLAPRLRTQLPTKVKLT